MNESIQVINKNGDAMNTEGISYIELTETNKRYLFYTLNEKVDNGLTKIYIAEVAEDDGTTNPINDTEWDELRKKMVKISHHEEVPEISYLPMGDKVFNIGEPKKLAVSDLNKQAFKDAQITHSIAANQSEAPAVGGGTTFFASEPTPTPETQESSNESIFTNPPQPVETNTVSTEQANVMESQTDVPVVTPVEPITVENPIGLGNEVVSPISEVPTIESVTPIEQPAIQSTEAISAPQAVTTQVETPVIEDIPAIPITPVEPVAHTESEQTVQTSEISREVTGTQKTIITDEEALKAISVIQDYIEQEEAA